MSKIICRFCKSDQAYKQQDEDKITWVHCPACQNSERIKDYFKRAGSTNGLRKLTETDIFN